MHVLRKTLALAGAALAGGGAMLPALSAGGCAATDSNQLTDDDGGPGGKTGQGGAGGGISSGGAGQGGTTFTSVGGGGSGGEGGSTLIDPCNSQCGDTELCDGKGLDDNCNGQVDEGCTCTAGTAQACFKGDPSFLDEPGCFSGTQKCTELGIWGECEGGVHATDGCAEVSVGCHPIASRPFVTVDLKDGTGSFSMDATSETFTVTCPPGINPCPTVNGSSYTPLQSGEYTVTYEKTTANGMDQCTFPLFVGAPGLRVELTWEWEESLGSTVDLDLHVHKPNDTQPWGGSAGNAVDCAYSNCTALSFLFPLGPIPDWFNGVAPPDPVDWYLDPVFENNTCYFGPKGNGQEWQNIGMGCHNPRLDIDNIVCDPTITDSQNADFCNPENINIDFPPKGQWTRIGVHYYSGSESYDVHPVVKVFCNGQLAAELGNQGYYDPEAPVTFPPSDAGDRFWLVGDVLFPDDECVTGCVVEPLYADPVAKTPILTTDSQVTVSFGPSYPPVPSP